MANNASSSKRAAWHTAIAGLISLAIAMGIGRFVYTPILPHMIGADALDPGDAGILAGANFFGYLLGAIIAAFAFFAARIRFWFFTGLIASVATTLLMSQFADAYFSYVYFLIIRFLSGLASAFVLVYASTLVLARLAELKRDKLSAIHFAGVGAGIALSSIVVSLMVKGGYDWQNLWSGAGLIALAGLVAVFVLLPRTSTIKTINEKEQSGKTFSAQLWLVIFSYGFFGFGYVITATFLNSIAKQDASLVVYEPWVWLIVGLTAIPSAWVWNRIAATIGILKAYILAVVLEMSGIIALLLVKTPASLIFSSVTLGLTFIGVTALGLIKARQIVSGDQALEARAIALMTVSFGTGQMVGPVIAGLLYNAFGAFDPALLSAVTALLLCIGFALRSAASERTQETD